MDREKVNTAISILDSLEYADKLKVYSRIFSLGLLNVSLTEKMVLISLVGLVTQKMREKDPTITPLNVLLKITGQVPDNSSYYQFLEGLSVLVEDISYGCTQFDPCGLKSSQEIINKIKEILNTWLPF